MRGTADAWVEIAGVCRITPACAGNSPQGDLSKITEMDHPRVCGEQTLRSTPQKRSVGSPPRVRGTDEAAEKAQIVRRITPACAGNRYLEDMQNESNADHPRVCGEQSNISLQPGKQAGSPPRVRGTDSGAYCKHKFSRITPACAGNSTLDINPDVVCEDHPRVCGEQLVIAALGAMVVGSPPRVRGTEISVNPNANCCWITPACAGNSSANGPTTQQK